MSSDVQCFVVLHCSQHYWYQNSCDAIEVLYLFSLVDRTQSTESYMSPGKLVLPNIRSYTFVFHLLLFVCWYLFVMLNMCAHWIKCIFNLRSWLTFDMPLGLDSNKLNRRLTFFLFFSGTLLIFYYEISMSIPWVMEDLSRQLKDCSRRDNLEVISDVWHQWLKHVARQQNGGRGTGEWL